MSDENYVKMNFNDENIDTIPNPDVYYMCSPLSDSKGMTYLMKLCLMTIKYPHLNDKIDEYLSDNKEELNKQNACKWTALMLACANLDTWSSKETIKILLKNNANVNLQNDNDLTALMFASINPDNISVRETIKLLLKNNANIGLRDKYGLTVFSYVSLCNDIKFVNEMVRLLLKEYIKKEHNLLSIVKRLLTYEHNPANRYIKKRLIIEYNEKKFI